MEVYFFPKPFLNIKTAAIISLFTTLYPETKMDSKALNIHISTSTTLYLPTEIKAKKSPIFFSGFDKLTK